MTFGTAAATRPDATSVEVGHRSLAISVDLGDDQRRATMRIGSGTEADQDGPASPLVSLLTGGEARDWAGTRYLDSATSRRLRVRGYHQERHADWQYLTVTQTDPQTHVEVATTIAVPDNVSAVRIHNVVTNRGNEPLTLRAVTSAIAPITHRDRLVIDAAQLLRGRNDWLAENRWRTDSLRDAGLPHLPEPEGEGYRARGAVRATSTSSWSTGEDLPVGVVEDPVGGRSWMWQIEHNGPWHWQLAETTDGVHLACLGPTDDEHAWSLALQPGATFETVPAAVAVARGDWSRAAAAMTEMRRVSHRESARPGSPRLPIVFNDYMNTLMGDPTTDRLLPLVDAAARLGSEVFVIDAGWYDDGGDWWDSVGEWQPSTRRFPEGFGTVLDHIRSRGMIAGLWLEPEVVGVRSAMAEKLPFSAFMHRDGDRIVENGRYHLNLTDPAAREHLDEVVDRVVADYGVGFLKLDYNISAGVGTDNDRGSAGNGLLEHSRAYQAWLDGVLTRHPELFLENCASGAMRQDFAMTSRTNLQSTSDQQVPTAYPPIAAAAAMMLAPERVGVWAYPQPGMTDDEIIFTMVTGLSGRLYLSGFVDAMTDEQRALVADAVSVHDRLRGRLARSLPIWPTGLPSWEDPILTAGTFDPADCDLVVAVWRRDGAPTSTTIELANLIDAFTWLDIETLYPIAADNRSRGADAGGWTFQLDAEGQRLHIHCTSSSPTARVVRLQGVRTA